MLFLRLFQIVLPLFVNLFAFSLAQLGNGRSRLGRRSYPFQFHILYPPHLVQLCPAGKDLILLLLMLGENLRLVLKLEGAVLALHIQLLSRRQLNLLLSLLLKLQRVAHRLVPPSVNLGSHRLIRYAGCAPQTGSSFSASRQAAGVRAAKDRRVSGGYLARARFPAA